MKTALNLVVAMMVGTLLSTAIPTSAAQRTTGNGVPRALDGESGKSGSTESATKEKRVKKKRRSSGKQIIEDTTIARQIVLSETSCPKVHSRQQLNPAKKATIMATSTLIPEGSPLAKQGNETGDRP